MLKLVSEGGCKSSSSSDLTRCNSFLSSQYAMFLTLVFLAELVAGVSGFIFRHEVRR